MATLPTNDLGYKYGDKVTAGYAPGEYGIAKYDSRTGALLQQEPQYKQVDLGGAPSAYDKGADKALSYYSDQANMRIDPEQNYNEVLNQFQAEIDAQNAIYAQKLKQAQVQGQGRLGSGTAVQARRGLLGSDFGASQTQQTVGYNNEVEDLVRQEQSAKIAQIMGLARKQSAEQIAEKRRAKEAGLEKYLEYLSQGETRKQTNTSNAVKILLNQGLSIEDIDPAQLSEFARQQGTSIDAIKAAYAEQKSALDAAAAEADLKTRQAEAGIGKTEADTAKTQEETAFIEKKFLEDQRQYGMDYALKARAQALDERKQSFDETTKNNEKVVADKNSQALSTANDVSILLDDPNFDSTFGPLSTLARNNPFAPQYTTAVNIQNIKAQASLAARGGLKGQGQISDFEGKMLAEAALALDINMPAADARKALTKMRGAIMTSSGGSAQVKITAPDGAAKNGPATQQDITDAISSGYKVEYI